MAFETITQGLTLTIPTNGTRNWGTVLKNTTWTKISAHNHTGGGNGLQLGSSALVDFSVTQNKMSKNRGDFHFTTPLVPAGTTQTVDWVNGQFQDLDLGSASGDVTLTLSNPINGGRYVLLITQGATPRDIIWPASVKWPQGQKLILSQGNNEIDKVELLYDGSIYYADWNNQYS